LGGFSTTGRFSGAVNIMAGRLQIGFTTVIGTGANPISFSGGTLNTTFSRPGVTVDNPINVTADSAITTTSSEATVDLILRGNAVGGAGKLTIRNDAPSGIGVIRSQLV